MRALLLCTLLLPAFGAEPDWSRVHYRAPVRMDTSGAPNFEAESHRVPAPPSSITSEMFRTVEAAQKRVYPGAITIPTMATGASDKVFFQAKGVQSCGIGPLREAEIYRFTQYNWEVVSSIAGKN